jgi:hypothetical protein
VHMMWRHDVVDHRKITCVPQLVEETPDDRLVGLVHDHLNSTLEACSPCERPSAQLEDRMLAPYQHVVDDLRRDAADRMGQAVWPDAKLRPTETRTETKDQHRRTRKASDPETTRSEASSWSRLSESNRRPTHYECVALAD